MFARESGDSLTIFWMTRTCASSDYWPLLMHIGSSRDPEYWHMRPGRMLSGMMRHPTQHLTKSTPVSLTRV